MVAWCFAAARIRPLERLVIMNVPHPLCFRAALKHWRQRRKSWYIGFFQLPALPERLLRRTAAPRCAGCSAACACPPEVVDVYASQIAEPGAATAMLNWYRAARLRTEACPDLDT